LFTRSHHNISQGQVKVIPCTVQNDLLYVHRKLLLMTAFNSEVLL